jgi:hypothetical protein
VTATQGKSAMPGPAEVGAKIWQHLKDPFYDRGTNDKGIGIQLAYSIARVAVGYLLHLNPDLPTDPLAPRLFGDQKVTVGGNLYYPTTSSWDYATGWGSPIADKLVPELLALQSSGG